MLNANATMAQGAASNTVNFNVEADKVIVNARLELFRIANDITEWERRTDDEKRGFTDQLKSEFNEMNRSWLALDQALSSILSKELEHDILNVARLKEMNDL